MNIMQPSLPNEIWKQIKDHPGYFVSNTGRVKSMKYSDERIIKECQGRVHLFKHNKRLSLSVKKLMFASFHDVSLDKLKDVYIFGNSLESFRPLYQVDYCNEIGKLYRARKTPELIGREYEEAINDLNLIIEAFKTGDCTKLSNRILSCKSNTIGYLIKKFNIKKATAEDIWQAVSSDTLIRIMKKESVVRDIQGYINISAKGLYLNSVRRKKKECVYNDNYPNTQYN